MFNLYFGRQGAVAKLVEPGDEMYIVATSDEVGLSSLVPSPWTRKGNSKAKIIGNKNCILLFFIENARMLGCYNMKQQEIQAIKLKKLC